MAKKSFYAVLKGHGRTPYIYTSWNECKAAVDGYKGAIFKGFTTKEEALDFIQGKGTTPVVGKPKKNPSSVPLALEDTSGVQEALPEVIIYTDGGCLYNPGGPGGYGAVLRFPGGGVKELSGGLANTTNNRMEMLAAIKALESLEVRSRVTLHTDSQYLKNSIEKKWVYKWQANNWLKSDETPAKNRDLWEILLSLLEKHAVKLIWVKGHAGNPDNERCDQLATLAMGKPDLKEDRPI